MFEQHAIYQPGIQASDVPYIPVTASGESALYGDEMLHEQLGLPDYVAVATDPQTGLQHL